jgi:Ca2+-binding EF-hand superfamily protein
LITKEEKNTLLEEFKKLDISGDGILSKDEMYKTCKNIYGEEQADQMIVLFIFTFRMI